MPTKAVEFVSLCSGSGEELTTPQGALIDARLVLLGLVTDAAGAGLFAVAGARGADFGSDGCSQVVDSSLR